MAVLVNRGVRYTLVHMAFPMLAGTFAANTYALADAYFVSKLGTLPLAAMAFTFPVVMMITFIAGGLGTGVTALSSSAMGRDDHDEAARLVTHGIALTTLTTILLAGIGYLTMDPVFRWLGADSETMPYIRQFMCIWFFGALTMSLPMMGNGILISAGDSRGASLFMIIGAAINVILNPLLIFGYLGLPALGIRGSALATVIAQLVSTVWLMYLLYHKHRLLALRHFPLREYIESFRRIISFAIPCILGMILMPISATVITQIVSKFGNAAVAAVGAASRLESFAFIIPMALGMSLTPFVSQNFGAARLDRIRQARTLAVRFALGYGGVVAVLFFLAAPQLAALFSDEQEVIKVLTMYLRLIPFGYGMMETHRYCGFVLTGLQKPTHSTILNTIRVIVLLIPLTWLMARLLGVRGVFVGRLITDISVGTLGLVWVARVLRSAMAQQASAALPAEEDDEEHAGHRMSRDAGVVPVQELV